CNLTCPTTFFAIKNLFYSGVAQASRQRRSASRRPSARREAEPDRPEARPTHLRLFHLPILQFHRGVTPENVNCDLELALVRVDFFNRAAEIQERTIVNLDRFADIKVNLGTFGLFGFRNLRFDRGDFLVTRRGGTLPADKANNP